MNIDVREYLRINPISVHELTLSGDGKDCFLYFPANDDDKTGYEVYTQKTMFWSICKSIFEDLITGNQNHYEINCTINGTSITWDGNIHLKDSQFKNYTRKTDWENYKTWIEGEITELEKDVEKKIFALKIRAKLDYIGATEIQSEELKKQGWKKPVWPEDGDWSNWNENVREFWEDADNIYKSLENSIGNIWCVGDSGDAPTGHDTECAGNKTVSHYHANTSAEAMTFPFAKNFGGGDEVGNYGIGSQFLVAQDVKFTDGATMFSLNGDQDTDDDGLTYPLYGQNVIDFRTRQKKHNNIPPSLNVWVKYKAYADNIASLQLAQWRSGDSGEIEVNAAEAQYSPQMVPDLVEYTGQDLTESDCVLRMTVGDCTCKNCNCDNISLKRQSLQMLLDIFAKDTYDKLGVLNEQKQFIDMQQILWKKLDLELVMVSEFMSWYSEQMDALKRIYGKIKVLQDLLVSVKPMTYVGRVIISTTDDTEKKVIKNYGGRHWRRIVNFLRGVQENSMDIGRKFGEAYVCLRESNVPIHTHKVQRSGDFASGQEWIKQGNSGQEMKIVNNGVPEDAQIDQTSHGLGNGGIEYQLSPLEYQETDHITYPHDNIPPYKEVYIWECTETTDDERKTSGEPPQKTITIKWDVNGGVEVEGQDYEWSGIPSGTTLGNHGQDFPIANKTGYRLNGWTDKHGEPVTENTVIGNDDPTTFCAAWKEMDIQVTFDANCGKFQDGNSIKQTMFKFDERLRFPQEPEVMDTWGDNTTFLGWFTDRTDGTQVGTDTKVDNVVTYYAQYGRILRYKNISNVGMTDNEVATDFSCGSGTPKRYLMTTKQLNFNENWTLVVKVKTGDDVWTNQEIFATNSGANMEFGVIKQAGVDTCRFGWELANGGDGGICGERVEVQPNTEYTVKVDHQLGSGNQHTFICQVWDPESSRWIEDLRKTRTLSIRSGNIILGQDEDSTAEYWRGWIYPRESYINIKGCKYSFQLDNIEEVTFNANGGTMQNGATTITMAFDRGHEIGKFPTAARTGHNFLGWFTLASGGEQVFESTEITRSTTYYAHWEAETFTITWDKQNGEPPTEQNMAYGSTITLPSASPTHEGFTFDKWYLDPGEKTIPISNGRVVNGSETYYAHWLGKSLTVTFNPNGGAVSPTTKSVRYCGLYGELPNATRNGYSFTGWLNLDGHPILPETSVENSGNHTLYAQWTERKYALHFNSMGGNPETHRIEVNYGERILGIPESTKAGHRLIGWFTDPSGGSKLNENTVWNNPNDGQFYAHWDVMKYTVVFLPNGGSGSMANQTFDYGTSIRLRENAFTSEKTLSFNTGGNGVTIPPRTVNLEFQFWSDGEDNKYNDRAILENIDDSTGDTIYLLAEWKPVATTLPNPGTWNYRTFNGWYDESGRRVGTTGDTYQIGRSETLTARWTINYVTITFDSNGGE